MKHLQYFEKGKYGYPKKGVVGVESDWLEFGTLEVPLGLMWLGDATVLAAEDGLSIEVPPGTYCVELKGMDFKGIRVCSRVRVFDPSVRKFKLGPQKGEAITDSSMIGICDMRAMKAAVTARYLPEFEKDLREAHEDGAGTGIDTFLYGKKKFSLAYILSGIGDGAYPVFTLESEGKLVGIECEFLPPGYKMH